MEQVAVYEERLVLFIDILGFKDHLSATVDKENKDCTDKIQYVINAYDIIRKHLLKPKKKIRKKNITIFSDCIVVSLIPEDHNIYAMFEVISNLIVLLLQEKILCRGGVSFGKIIHKTEYVFGPALVEAYMLEDKVANYPRVIVHDSVLNEVHNKSLVNKKDIVQSFLKRDFDGYYYFDYFNKNVDRAINKYSKEYLEVLSVIWDIVSDGFDKFIYPGQIAIRAKYIWMNKKLREPLQEMYSDFKAPSDDVLDKYKLSRVVLDKKVPDLVHKSDLHLNSSDINLENPFKYENFGELYGDNIFGILDEFLFKNEEEGVLKSKIPKSKSKYHN